MHLKLSVIDFARLLSIFAMFQLGALSIKKMQDFKQLVVVLIFSAVIPVAAGIYQFLTEQGMNVPAEAVYNRIYGTFYHPSSFAQYMVLVMALSLILFFMSRKFVPGKLFSLFAIFFSLLVIVITYTRGSWIALLVFFISIAVMKFRMVLVPIIIIPIFLYVGVASVQNRVNITFSDPDSSLFWRLNMFRDSLEVSQDHLILGVGVGTSEELMRQKRNLDDGVSSATHNDYIKALVESGVFGLLSFVFLIANLGLIILRVIKNTTSKMVENISVVLLGMFVALYVWHFADVILQNVSVQWAWWSVIGAFCGLILNDKLNENSNC